jgi:hypothetical protein
VSAAVSAGIAAWLLLKFPGLSISSSFLELTDTKGSGDLLRLFAAYEYALACRAGFFDRFPLNFITNLLSNVLVSIGEFSEGRVYACSISIPEALLPPSLYA